MVVGEWCICNKYAEKAVSGKSAEGESSDRSAQADAQDELHETLSGNPLALTSGMGKRVQAGSTGAISFRNQIEGAS